VHTARFALRPGPDGDIDAVFLMGILQERSILSDPDQPNSPEMPFEGGATLVVDLRRLSVRYCVRKNVNSKIREARQQQFTATQLEGLRATYFGAAAGLYGREPFAVMHRGR
jgi:hypothetical protein